MQPAWPLDGAQACQLVLSRHSEARNAEESLFRNARLERKCKMQQGRFYPFLAPVSPDSANLSNKFKEFTRKGAPFPSLDIYLLVNL